jgi:hypothetical protein
MGFPRHTVAVIGESSQVADVQLPSDERYHAFWSLRKILKESAKEPSRAQLNRES